MGLLQYRCQNRELYKIHQNKGQRRFCCRPVAMTQSVLAALVLSGAWFLLSGVTNNIDLASLHETCLEHFLSIIRLLILCILIACCEKWDTGWKHDPSWPVLVLLVAASWRHRHLAQPSPATAPGSTGAPQPSPTCSLLPGQIRSLVTAKTFSITP